MTSQADPYLQIKDLAVQFTGGGQLVEAVRGVSVDVRQGETVALVGESGSGKSVTALSVLQLLPKTARFAAGEVLVNRQDMLSASAETLRSVRGADIGMIFQEPMTSLNPLHTVGKQIGETLRVHGGLSRKAARDRALELLERVRLPDPVQKLVAYPHELSGGQRQRVMIAMALANEPKLLIADEPTTALDVTIQAQILDLLKQLQAESGMGLLLITHDLSIVRAVADRVCVMTQGKIVESQATQVLFDSPQHDYTQRLLASEPKGQPITPLKDPKEVLRVDDFGVQYRVGRGWFGRPSFFTAVQPLSMRLTEGQSVGLVGESGSGKTSLGLALLRLTASTGSLYLSGEAVHELSQRKLRPYRRQMQMVFQDPFGSLSPRMTVGQILEEGLLIHEPQLTKDQRMERIEEVLVQVGLEPSMSNRYPHEFSGGQRQRIAIGRAIALRPQFLVLDEPTSALDMTVQAQVVDLLRDLQAQMRLTYLFISHDLKVVRALCHYIVVLQAGEVVEEGPAEQLFGHPSHDYTKQLLSAAFVG